jgi:hypothetical protein
MQIHMYNAEDVFSWLDLMSNHIVEMCWGMWAEPKERDLMVSKLTEGLGLIEAGIRVWGHWLNEQWVPTTRKVTVRMLACWEEVLEEKKSFLFCFTSLLDFFKSYPGIHTSLSVLVLLDTGDDDHMTYLQFRRKRFLLKLIFCYFIFCVN